MKHLIPAILIVSITSFVGQATEPNTTIDSALSWEQTRVLADSIYGIGLNYYPQDLLDSAAWRVERDMLQAPDPTIVREPKFATNIFEFARMLGDTAAEVFTAADAQRQDSTNAATADSVVSYMFTSNFGYLRISGFHNPDSLDARLERALHKLRDMDALAINISGPLTGSEEAARRVAGHFTREPYIAYIIRRRIPGTTETKDDTVSIFPRGKRTFKGPIVIANEHGSSEGLRCFIEAMRRRPNVRFTRGGPHYTDFFRGMGVVTVPLPFGYTMKVPTATMRSPGEGRISGHPRGQRGFAMETSIDWAVYPQKRDLKGPRFAYETECWIVLNQMMGYDLRMRP